MRDRTDIESLTRQLDAVQTMSSALRAQRHEFANRLHVISALIHGRHFAETTGYIDSLVGTGPLGEALPGVEAVSDSYVRAFLAAKAAQAREAAVTLVVGEATWVDGRVAAPVDVTTVCGNLVDNAIDAARDGARQPARVEVELMTEGTTLLITVADTGDGVPADLADAVFREGVSTKNHDAAPGGRGIGLALARQIARARGGDVYVAERGGPPTGSGSVDSPAPERVSGGAVFVARLPDVMESSR
ncbi:ATP-binding protein [Streptomyces sp. M19]